MGIGLTEAGAREAEYRTAAAGNTLPRLVEPLPSNELAKAKKAMKVARRIERASRAKKRKKERAIFRHPDTFGDSGGWVFPAYYERQHHRQGEEDEAE